MQIQEHFLTILVFTHKFGWWFSIKLTVLLQFNIKTAFNQIFKKHVKKESQPYAVSTDLIFVGKSKNKLKI